MKIYYSERLQKMVTIPDYDDHIGEWLEDRYSEYLGDVTEVSEFIEITCKAFKKRMNRPKVDFKDCRCEYLSSNSGYLVSQQL